METIKRYSNRKLYSNTLNRYVSLDYIKALVKTSQNFQVIESKSGKDITTDTMKKLLGELDLSAEFMVNLIRSR